MENGIPARRRMLGDFDVYEAANLQLFRGDFFKLTPALLGRDRGGVRPRGADFLGAGAARGVCAITSPRCSARGRRCC